MQQVKDDPARVSPPEEHWSDMPLYRRTNDEERIDFYQEVTDRERGRYIDMDCVPTPQEILMRQDAQIALDAQVGRLLKTSLKLMSAREKNRLFGYIRGVE